jgi:glycosyltransferase involved in cell wall biosynthesis
MPQVGGHWHDPASLVSIVIDNYNYARYLSEAVDSALAQDYPNLEVVVVDDGSTDDSRDVIRLYSDRIRPVFKSNGGQASAMNAGLTHSRGAVVLFLDSDDILSPGVVTQAVALFDPTVAKVHWPLSVVDSVGRPTGQTKPGRRLPEGNLRDAVLRTGPSNCASPPTSGNAWARWFLERVMPIPEDVPYYRICGDEYLFTLAPVFGEVRAIHQPQGRYRIHGRNIYSGRSFRDMLELELAGYDQQCSALAAVLRREGFDFDPDGWRRHSWFHKLGRALDLIDRTIPKSQNFILVDNDTWGRDHIFKTGRVQPFIERDGSYWGPPADDGAAIQELDRLRSAGANFLVIAWPAFWWRDHYAGFQNSLESRFTRCCATDDVAIYDLRDGQNKGKNTCW